MADPFATYDLTPDQIVAKGDGWTIARDDRGRWRVDVFGADGGQRCCPWIGGPDLSRADVVALRLASDFAISGDVQALARVEAMACALRDIAHG